MFRKNPALLTAALLGHGAIGVSALDGCFPAYSSGASYNAGDRVSEGTSVATTTTESCSPAGTSTCPSSGTRTVTTTTTVRRNYECVQGPSSAFCSNSAYAPGGQYSGSAWTQLAECDGTAPVPAPLIPNLWAGGGCPKAYVAGTDYDPMDVVSVAGTAYSMVFQCAASPTNLFCGMAGYSPVDGQFADQAWTSLGSCNGTIAPTGSPSFDVLADEGGCPKAFSSGESYEEGDKISLDGLVYQCKSFPSSQHCSQAGYEPGTSIGTGAQMVEYWKDAWMVVGYCSGTIAPTGSPSFDVLQDMGGCPDSWMAQTYEEGDKVSDGSLVYQCKAWPFSGHCGQAGYEPNVDTATRGAWKDAWSVVGYCNGSIGPTSSPTIDPATSVGVCPDEWVRGSHVAYEEGDMVSVTVSETPLRKVAYRCKAWPYSGFCGQLSPDQFGGDQGWAVAGGCDGSIGPTQSPSFDSLGVVGKCPEEWSASNTDYEAGDRVSYTVSTDPVRKIVYECRQWPNSGYCNQGAGFEPGTTYSNLAWILKGSCDGTFAPTTSPDAYHGTCQYNKCVTTEVQQVCTPGSTGCSCSAGQTASSSCVRDVDTEVCTLTNVNVWTSGIDYVTDDVVRVGTARFRCREWPNFFWCRSAAYVPSLTDNSIWPQAWRRDGTCP